MLQWNTEEIILSYVAYRMTLSELEGNFLLFKTIVTPVPRET